MALVVVGGHTRNIGKTSVMAGLIAALGERRWVAMKITQFGHGICSADGKECGCATADHTVAISEEQVRGSGTDTSRYLEAGAERSVWVRTRQGSLHEAMPRLRAEFTRAAGEGRDVMVESNSLLRFVRPEVFVSVLDPGVEDFKGSARRYLDRADAILMPREVVGEAGWSEEVRRVVAGLRVVRFSAPEYVTSELVTIVRAQIGAKRDATGNRGRCSGL